MDCTLEAITKRTPTHQEQGKYVECPVFAQSDVQRALQVRAVVDCIEGSKETLLPAAGNQGVAPYRSTRSTKALTNRESGSISQSSMNP